MIEAVDAAGRKKSIVLKVLAGILIAFIFLGGLTAMAAYRWYSSPETQEQIGAAKDFVKLMIKGAQAPGAEDLRKLGCDQAAVFSAEETAAFMESMGKFAKSEERGTLSVPMILCNVRLKKSIDCKSVTVAYSEAVAESPNEILVMMQTQAFPQQVVCSGLYRKDGTLVESLQ
jgi:hypothetical protein